MHLDDSHILHLITLYEAEEIWIIEGFTIFMEILSAQIIKTNDLNKHHLLKKALRCVSYIVCSKDHSYKVWIRFESW